jgi:AraC-like DNA-binding protein
MAERCRKQNIEFTGRQAWLGRIRQLLSAQLNAAPGLEGWQQMNCSPRTLRRHLKDMGSSYQELLDELRFERAKQMLCEDQLPIYRIAETLGFSETASFRHAFVRWSVAPSQFRPEDQRSQPSAAPTPICGAGRRLRSARANFGQFLAISIPFWPFLPFSVRRAPQHWGQPNQPAENNKC